MKYAHYTNAALNKIKSNARDSGVKGGNNKNNSDVFVSQLRNNNDLSNFNTEVTSRRINKSNTLKNLYQSQVSFKHGDCSNSTIQKVEKYGPGSSN